MLTDSNITITQGDSMRVVVPVRDGNLSVSRTETITGEATVTTVDGDQVTVEVSDQVEVDETVYRNLDDVRVDYVIAEAFDKSTIQYQAAEQDVSVLPFGDLKATDPDVPDDQPVAVIDIPRTETAALSPGEYVHECQIVDQRDREATVMQGTVLVQETATVETETEGWTPL